MTKAIVLALLLLARPCVATAESAATAPLPPAIPAGAPDELRKLRHQNADLRDMVVDLQSQLAAAQAAMAEHKASRAAERAQALSAFKGSIVGLTLEQAGARMVELGLTDNPTPRLVSESGNIKTYKNGVWEKRPGINLTHKVTDYIFDVQDGKIVGFREEPAIDP